MSMRHSKVSLLLMPSKHCQHHCNFSANLSPRSLFSADQLKVILGLAEQLKKQTDLVDHLQPEKEDLTAKLEVR